MNQLPLYTNIVLSIKKKHLEDVELIHKQKDNLCKNIKKLDPKGHELIYVLIRHHQMITHQLTIGTMPYNSKNIKSGIKFDVDQFPTLLKQIILHFVDIHIKSTKESKNNPIINIKNRIKI